MKCATTMYDKNICTAHANVIVLHRFKNWINKAEQHGINPYDIKENIFNENKVEPYSKTI